MDKSVTNRKLGLLFFLSATISLQATASDAGSPAKRSDEIHSHTVASTPVPTTVHTAPASVDSDVALRWLRNGNTRFVKGFLRNDGQSHADIARLSSGQNPHSIVLSCSDSRVPPEVVFDQKLGEIFVVRTAGETLDPTSIASIEYAVEHLGTQNLVVMGHTQCGAVKAALSTLDGKDAGSENLNKLVADIHPRLQSFKSKPASSNFEDESWANVEGVAKDLLKRSPLLTEKVHQGKLKITGSLYHLDTGRVDFKNPEPPKSTPRSLASEGAE